MKLKQNVSLKILTWNFEIYFVFQIFFRKNIKIQFVGPKFNMIVIILLLFFQ